MQNLTRAFLRSLGWPRANMTEEEKQAYIADYALNQGILLDYDLIVSNPSRRTLAKLMLNCLWGKLGQSPNLPKTTIVRSNAAYFALATNPEEEIIGEYNVHRDVVMVCHRKRDLKDCKPGNTSVAIASMVTAYGRIRLFKLIHEIERVREGRLLYFDTDSAMFVKRVGDPEISTGIYLGDLTSEIDSATKVENSRGISAAFLGPKTYALQIQTPCGKIHQIVKAKGITLTVEALRKVTYESMSAMAEAYSLHPDDESQQIKLTVDQTLFRADKGTQKVYTKDIEKRFQAVSDKRIVIGNDTRAFGYCEFP